MKLVLSALAALVLGAAAMPPTPQPSRVVGGMGLITATTTIMAGITVGTTTGIGMRGVGRTNDNSIGQISARLP